MADTAAQLAKEIAELKRRLTAVERGPQLAYSTVELDGAPVSVPVALGAGVTAKQLTKELGDTQEILDAAQKDLAAAAVERDAKLEQARTDLTAAEARLEEDKGRIDQAFGTLAGIPDQIDSAQSAAVTAAAANAKAEAEAAEARAAATAAADAQQKADAAQAAALAAAKTYAEAQASGASSDALAAAKADATAKANAAQAAAIAAAALDATAKKEQAEANAAADAKTKADAALAAAKADATQKAADAQAAAIAAAALVAQAKADNAQSAATTAAAADAKTKADAAQAAALAAAKTYAEAQASGASSSAITAAAADAKSKADAAKAAAITAAAADAKSKADAAKAGAITEAANDATTKANNAQAAAIAAASTDASTKADLAKTDAVAAATTMTNGIGKNLSSTAVPTTSNKAPKGSIWRRVDTAKNIIGVWEQTGTGVAGTWTPRLITSDVVDNLDVGKLSASAAVIADLVAQKIAASTASFQTADIANLFVSTATMSEVVAQAIYTAKLKAGKILADEVLIGTSNLLGNPNFEDNGAGWENPSSTRSYDNTGQGMNGAGSLLLGPTSGQAGSYYGLNDPTLRPRVIPGDYYRISAWFLASAAAPANAATVYVRFYDDTGSTTWLSLPSVQSLAVAANTWTKVEGIVQAPNGATTAVMGLYTQNNFSGSIRWSMPSLMHAVDSALVVKGAITSESLASQLVLATDIIAGDPAGTHALINGNGIRVLASTDGGEPAEVVRLGTDTDDYFGVVGPDGNLSASINSAGDITGQNVDVAGKISLAGENLGERINYMPQRLKAWAQIPINNSTMKLVPGQTEVGLYELGWDSDQGDLEERMYEFNVHEFMVMSSVNGIVGIRLRLTTNGSAPTVNSGILGFNYSYCLAGNYTTLGMSRLVGSNNGNFVRVLVCLYNGSGGAVTVLNSGGQTNLFASVQDLGGTVAGLGQPSLGGGPTGGTPVPPPVNPKVTTTKEYAATGTRSFTGDGSFYNYNTGKAYSGQSPAGYGDLSSIAVFPSLTALLSGATVNDIWVYAYYDFWYYGSGGNAAIGVHGAASLPGSKPSLSLALMSNGWPRASGRWVRLPDSTYAGFKSGAYKGFSLGGHGGGLTEYGYASDLRIRIRYTK